MAHIPSPWLESRNGTVCLGLRLLHPLQWVDPQRVDTLVLNVPEKTWLTLGPSRSSCRLVSLRA